jgi:PAS domain S-box-containing protein
VPTLFDEMIAYIRFGDTDRAALSAFAPAARPHFVRITDEFYERLRAFPRAAAVFRNVEQIDRLKVTLRNWLERLLAGPWDDDYFELRSRIGRVHVKVKLPQHYMFTAIDVIRTSLMSIAETSCTDDPQQLSRTLHALSKILDLELAIMLQTYREDTMNQARRYESLEKDLLERRLEISEARYHEIVENAGVMMIAVDTRGHVVLFNRKAEQVSDYRRAEVIGKDCLALLCHEDSHDVARQALMRAYAGDPVVPFDARMITRTGDIRWVHWQVTQLAAPGGAIAAVIGLDITDERSLQERTRRAERLAGLGTLAAGLAHEIRNPLNSAKLQLTLVERRLARGDDPDNRDRALAAARLVHEELRRLAGLVEEFLDFARPRELRFAGADLAETARTVLALVAPEATERGIQISGTHDIPVVARYDDERIKQVLLNLVRNAFEAAGDGGHVEVRVVREAEGVRVEVEDSGQGPPADVDIFAPFMTTKEAGTGLGLPIVHRIVSDHGGEVYWERRAERTVFVMELPLDGPVAARP